MSAANKYSSFGGPGGIKAVPGLYVDYVRRAAGGGGGPFGIDIHMYTRGARAEERRANSARDRIIALYAMREPA